MKTETPKLQTVPPPQAPAPPHVIVDRWQRLRAHPLLGRFTDLKKRLQMRSALAITFEADRLVVDHVRRDDGPTRVVHTFALPVGAEAAIRNPEKTGEQLAAQLNATEIRERKAIVCIP